MYGIDLADHQLTASRSWVWLKNRIAGLLSAPDVIAPDGRLFPSTRLGWHFNPPPPPKTNQ